MATKTDYQWGYEKGLRDRNDKSGEFEQDFAYKSKDYTDGYYDGFHALPVREPVSYKPEVKADMSGKWSSNQLRFATEEEALDYVHDLAMRWTLVYDTRVIGSIEPVNYKLVDGKLEPV